MQVRRPDGGVHILAGQQDLSHGAVILGKKLVVDVHHHALAHSGHGLLPAQLVRALLQTQLPGADGDGAGGDQDDFVTHALQVGQNPGQVIHIV